MDKDIEILSCVDWEHITESDHTFIEWAQCTGLLFCPHQCGGVPGELLHLGLQGSELTYPASLAWPEGEGWAGPDMTVITMPRKVLLAAWISWLLEWADANRAWSVKVTSIHATWYSSSVGTRNWAMVPLEIKWYKATLWSSQMKRIIES